MADCLQSFRERLLLARRRRGWNQKQLADRAGMSLMTISRIESGATQHVYIETAVRLANALEMTTDELLDPHAPAWMEVSAAVGAP